VATANNWQLRAFNIGKSRIGLIGRIGLISPILNRPARHAPCAASRWRCALPAKAHVQDLSSGAARDTPGAKARGSSEMEPIGRIRLIRPISYFPLAPLPIVFK
jgi:hypothetical protein